MTLCDPTAAHRGHVPVSTSSWCAPERRNMTWDTRPCLGTPELSLSEKNSLSSPRTGQTEGTISRTLPHLNVLAPGEHIVQRKTERFLYNVTRVTIHRDQPEDRGLTSPWWLTQSRAEVKGSVTRQERKDRVGLEVGVGWIGDRTKSGGECGSQPRGVRSAATPKKTVVILQAWWRSLLGQVNFIQGHVTRGTPKKANTSRATVSSLYHFGFYQISKWFLAVSHIWSSWPACLSARLSLSLHTALQPVRSVQNKVKEGNAVKKLPLTNKSHCWVKRHTFC